MLSHDGLDGLGGLISVIEGNGADVMVKDMSLNDAVKQVSADETHLTVNCRSSATDEVPLLGSIVRQGRVGVLKKGNGNYTAG
jgi:hypothetical protein